MTSSSVGGALLLDAFDLVVPAIQDDGAELLLPTRHRIGELFVHRDLVLLRSLRILVGIDELHLDLSHSDGRRGPAGSELRFIAARIERLDLDILLQP